MLCRFSVYSTSIVIVCAHLAANRANVEHRNSDFHNIMKNTMLKKDKTSKFSGFSDPSSMKLLALCDDLGSMENDAEHFYLIQDHDLIFWIGDFNYRIDVSLTRQDIMQYIHQQQLADLRVFDQLNMQKSLSKVFEGFQEGELTFNPTYKYQVRVFDEMPRCCSFHINVFFRLALIYMKTEKARRRDHLHGAFSFLHCLY